MTTRDELQSLLSYPESAWLDWKREFPLGLLSQSGNAEWDKGKGTLLKDIAALANTPSGREAVLVFGVDDTLGAREVFGIQKSWDDATLQTWVRSAFDPPIAFSYAEVQWEPDVLVGVLRVPMSVLYPHVATKTVGGVLFEGRVWLRRGTQNAVASRDELQRMFTLEEPFKIRMLNDPTLHELEKHFAREGDSIGLPHFADKDTLVSRGYRIARYPGTRREIWVGEVDGRYEHILLLKPRQP